MAASQRRGRRPGGVVRAMTRLTLMISCGFAVGLLFGVLIEEPKLLADHLWGEGEAVELASVDGTVSTHEQDSSRPRDSATEALRPAAMEPRAGETPDRELPVVAASAPKPPPRSPATSRKDPAEDDSWAIQVGAFSDEAVAARLVVSLDAKGYSSALIPSTDGSQRWRVRVQPVRGKASAEEMAARLKRVEGLPTWVLPMEGRPR